MPKRPVLKQQFVFEKLLKYLSQSGPLKASYLCEFLGISQPTFSRLIAQGQNDILCMGRGSQRLYALKKRGGWVKPEIPVLSVDEKGTPSQVAILHSIYPQGFYLESQVKTLPTKIYKNLPYFFEDLRPSGFLGRLIPHLHSDLGVPEDIRNWTDDDCLLYLVNYGWDLIGNYFIGEKSYNLYEENSIQRLDVVHENDREKHYPRVANLVLSHGQAGSSAGGEHPKFLSMCEKKGERIPVLVKFSPPVGDAISHRIADLLICEHIAHEVLQKHGHAAPQSCFLRGEDRLFLEIERFDRNKSGGRLGVISLRALDLEFVGHLESWADTAESLFRQKKIDEVTYKKIVWLETFGKLIANTDRHHGNISFFCDGEKIKGLAPVYDMLPMMYAPQQNQLVPRPFNPESKKFSEISVWNDALIAAQDFWSLVRHHSQISEEFKILIADNESKLLALS